jgi:hypothetical protein
MPRRTARATLIAALVATIATLASVSAAGASYVARSIAVPVKFVGQP